VSVRSLEAHGYTRMMTPFQVETWALRVIEQVQNKEPIEDSRVELKREWIDANKAARRIAGHANVARGDPILWLIGVDEVSGVHGAVHNELANWWPAVAREFSEVAPSYMDVVVTPPGSPAIVALQFDTSRYPYVVRNEVFGVKGGGAVAWEIPWRQAASTRTALRSEVMLMLAGLTRKPDVKVLAAQIDVESVRVKTDSALRRLDWTLQADLFFMVREEITIPLHTCVLTMRELGQSEPLGARDKSIRLGPRAFPNVIDRADSVTVFGTSSELILRGSGLAELSATFETREFQSNELDEFAFEIEFTFTPVFATAPVIVQFEMRPRRRGTPMSGVACYALAPS
jgi:hypothetical protein